MRVGDLVRPTHCKESCDLIYSIDNDLIKLYELKRGGLTSSSTSWDVEKSGTYIKESSKLLNILYGIRSENV